MAILLSTNIAQCDDCARPRGVTTARLSVGLGLVEILSWMRHCIAIHSIKCFEMQDTNEKLRLTCGVTQRIATDHVRVPSPMIGQYTLDLRVNSIRDSGALERSNTTSRRGAVVQWLARPLVTPAAGVCSPDQAHY